MHARSARRLWKESDLDIFVENGSGAENMQSFILEKEGYTLVSKQRGLDLRDYHLGNIHEVGELFLEMSIFLTKIAFYV